MEIKREIARRDKKIETLKNEIKAKETEIKAMYELLNCAVANLMVAVKEKGDRLLLSKKAVSEMIGKHYLKAEDDGNGNYMLEIKECQT